MRPTPSSSTRLRLGGLTPTRVTVTLTPPFRADAPLGFRKNTFTLDGDGHTERKERMEHWDA